MIALNSTKVKLPAEVPLNSSWVPKWIAGLVGLMFVLICGLQLGVSSLFADRAYPEVVVAGQNISNMSYAQAQATLAAKVKRYKLSLNINGKQAILRPVDVGVSYYPATSLLSAFSIGREHWFAPFGLWQAHRSQPIHLAYQVDRPAQQRFIASMITSSGQLPVDASIEVVKGVPRVVPDKDGYALSGTQLAVAINDSIAALSPSTVSVQPSSQPARIRVANTVGAVERVRQLVATPVSLTYNDKTFTPTAADKGAWLTFTPSADKPEIIPTVDASKVAAYIASAVAARVNVVAVVRKVRVENGVSTETQPGADGLAVDVSPLAQTIADGLQKAAPVVSAIPTKPVAFKTDYNRVISLNYGRYIEINLSQQHLWVYQDHSVIFESPITSGATGAGFPTIQGLFSIQAKETNRYLNGRNLGYNYNVFVHYWMPFSGDYGMHDASWRSGNFGGQDYYYGGSHGCVNMPESTAAWIYNWGDIGTPVWVHG